MNCNYTYEVLIQCIFGILIVHASLSYYKYTSFTTLSVIKSIPSKNNRKHDTWAAC